MNFKPMFEKIRDINKKTGMNKLSIFIDMAICAIKYQAGYIDYYIFEMYNVSKENRKTYLTRGINNEYIRRLNDKAYWHIFKNKDEFNELFKEFLGRDFLNITHLEKKAVVQWLENSEVIFAKPRSGCCGKGILKINRQDYSSLDEIYNLLVNNNIELIETALIQHHIMNELHSNSVNTIRTISMLKNGVAHILAAYLRIGNGDFVDNFNHGGMVVPVDVLTGKVQFKAIDKTGNLYEKHPLSNVNIVGFEIPFWNEAKEMIKKSALIVPQVRLVGWDVAITEKGPVLIEGNQFPGHDIYQLPPHTPDKIGMLPIFEAVEKL